MMNEIFNLLYLSLRNMIISLSGFLMMSIVLERTAGFRFGKIKSIVFIFCVWFIRFFGFQIYIQTWLRQLYEGEKWYLLLLSRVSAFNILYGIMFIAICFQGNLLKNLLAASVMEMIFAGAMLCPLVLIYRASSQSFYMYGPWEPRDIMILLAVLAILLALIHYVDPWLERYKRWEPKHPAILAVVLAVYFIQAIFNNIHYALSSGGVGAELFLTMAFLVILWMWIAFFFKEKEEARELNRSLLRHETALKNHYERVLTQSTKINRYNQEIRKAMEVLMAKLLPDGTNETAEPFSDPEEDKMYRLARSYLQSLEDHYQEITVSRYSQDLEMNELLEAYIVRFRNLDLPLYYHFHRYIRPSEVSEEDMEKVLSFMLDSAIAGHEDSENNDTILQAGMNGEMLIISCEYSGNEPSKRERRAFRHILRRINADSNISTNQGRSKIIVGLKAI